MLTALSFLGTGNYRPTTYVLGEKRCSTHLFPVAMKSFFNPERLLVVMTREAEDKYGKELEEVCSYQPVRIPSGKNENELWAMFSEIASAISENVDMVIDITHGFRSQPMFALAAAVYLQAVKEVKVQGLYYGAFEAKDTESNETPVFDMTPVLHLMAWSSATESYGRGDAAPLKQLLDDIHRYTYTNPAAEVKSVALSRVGSSLNDLSQALNVIRPQEALNSAQVLVDRLEKVETDLISLPQTRPLAFLMDRIREDTLALAGADGELFSPAGFAAQAAMIDRYLKSGQVAQALTLAREAVVSRVAVEKKVENVDDQKCRTVAEQWLYEIGCKKKEKEQLSERHAQLGDLWNSLGDVRNDIDHAGMRKSRLSARKMYERADEVCKMAMEWISSASVIE